MKREYDLNDLRAAMRYINADDRETWVRAALAIKSTFGEDGFDIWDDWSASGGTYDAKTARMVWRNAKPRKVTAGTIFKWARDKGWGPDAPPPDTEQLRHERAQRQQERAERLAAEEAEQLQYHELVAAHSEEILRLMHRTGSSKYLGEKKVQAYGVAFAQEPILSVIHKDKLTAQVITAPAEIRKFLDDANAIPQELRPYSFRHLRRGCFAVPMRDIAGKLWGLQVIWPTGKKSFFYNGRKSGCLHIVGDIDAQQPIGICEGYATGASMHAAVKWPVACAFDAGNLMAVALALRAAHPNRVIVMCADNDTETEGNPGVTYATDAARAIGARICIPDFSAVKARAA